MLEYLYGTSSSRAKTFPVYILQHSQTFPPMKMEQTECSETSAYKIHTPGNYPEESIQISRT